MLDILNTYATISLGEMKAVRLMNRIDTKYVTTLPMLIRLLEIAQPEYMVQSIDGALNMPYYTLYYETPDAHMYMEHLRGRKRRQKIRIRKYVHSDVAFLEIKNKNNKGRTSKKRIEYVEGNVAEQEQFINEKANYAYSDLSKRIENKFSRITLVNKGKTERLTIDTNLRFHNLKNNESCAVEGLVIIEHKRDGNVYSPISAILNQLRIFPAKFSKYCMGMALTDSTLKRNRFKERLRMVRKICNVNNNINF
ncbi:MAG: VTC domain-containing protein [Prevotella sp.]|nr:VTC domain-containing protein [Prevotella sp.]